MRMTDVVPFKEAATRRAGLLTRIQVLRYAQCRGWVESESPERVRTRK